MRSSLRVFTDIIVEGALLPVSFSKDVIGKATAYRSTATTWFELKPICEQWKQRSWCVKQLIPALNRGMYLNTKDFQVTFFRNYFFLYGAFLMSDFSNVFKADSVLSKLFHPMLFRRSNAFVFGSVSFSQGFTFCTCRSQKACSVVLCFSFTNL